MIRNTSSSPSITDDLTTDFSRIAGSFVIARRTAFSHKGKSPGVRQIGRELGVRYALRRQRALSGSLVRINDAETGGQVWTERFATDRQKLADAEDETIGRLGLMNLGLVAYAGRRIEREKLADPDARDLMMHGWAWFYRPRSAASTRGAQRVLKQALALDRASIEARVGLA